MCANALYDLGREGFAGGDIDWDGDDIKVVLVDTDDYTANLATDNDLADIPAGARVSTSANLGSKTITAGVCDAADTTFTAAAGDQSEAMVIYQDTGTAATSRLIAYIDDATGLPVIPNGGNINVAWPSGASRIFKL